MATEVKLPRLGQGMEAGTIVRWLKAEGDEVAKGEPLFELDTDKVTQEVEADAAGVLLKIVVPEGEANVGATVAVIGSADEDVSELLTGAQGGNGDAPATPTDPPTVAVEPPAEARSAAKPDEQTPSGSGRQGSPSEAATKPASAEVPSMRAKGSRSKRARSLGGWRASAGSISQHSPGPGPRAGSSRRTSSARASLRRGCCGCRSGRGNRGRRAHVDSENDCSAPDRGLASTGLPAVGDRDASELASTRSEWSSSCGKARRSRPSTTSSRASSPLRSNVTRRSTRSSSTGGFTGTPPSTSASPSPQTTG